MVDFTLGEEMNTSPIFQDFYQAQNKQVSSRGPNGLYLYIVVKFLFFLPYGGEELRRVKKEGWEAKKPRQVRQSISLPYALLRDKMHGASL